MTILHVADAATHTAAQTDAMDEERDERRSGTDRRSHSGWSDPKTWVSIVAVLLSIVIALSGYLAATLSTIKDNVQTIVVSTAKQEEKMKAVEDRVKKLEDFESTQREAYNFNFTTRLAVVEAKTGVKPNGSSNAKNGD